MAKRISNGVNNESLCCALSGIKHRYKSDFLNGTYKLDRDSEVQLSIRSGCVAHCKLS